MERRIWSKTKGSILYPNLYVILAATPGVGKSNILSVTETLLRKVPSIFVAPSSLTTAALIDTVALSKKQLAVTGLMNGTALEYYSTQVIASELGVFLPAYDPPFMNTLTKLYDGEHYEERRRTGKVNHLIIERPLLSILGGTTPSYLNSFLPEGAWEQGFTSRTIFVFSNEKQRKPIWGDEVSADVTHRLEVDLLADLTTISNLYGIMDWSQDSMDAITDWDEADMKPVPDHIKLAHYNSRRLAHLLKLCMVACMARSNDLRVEMCDFITAKGWLLEAEHVMPDIFNAGGRTIDSSAIEEAKFFLKKLYIRDGRPVSEHLLVAFLRDRIPAHNIARVIEIMEKSRDIKRVLDKGGLISIVPL